MRVRAALFLLLCGALFALIAVVSSASATAALSPKSPKYVAAPLCCTDCPAPLGCCCARGNAVAATIWTTRTGTARRTKTVVRVATTTLTMARMNGVGRRAVAMDEAAPARPEMISAEVSDLELETEIPEDQPSRLMPRNLCPVCPAGAVFGNTGEAGLRPCCPHRKTVTRTRSKLATKVVIVTQRKTVTRTVLRLVPPQNQTIEAFFFFDVAGNGVYDPAADPPASGISVSLVAPWLAHARQDGMVPLVTAVTNSSGYIVFVTDKIKPNDIVQIVDEEGNVLSSLLAGPDGVVPPGLYKAAVIMSYLTTAARSKTASKATSQESATETPTASSLTVIRTATSTITWTWTRTPTTTSQTLSSSTTSELYSTTSLTTLTTITDATTTISETSSTTNTISSTTRETTSTTSDTSTTTSGTSSTTTRTRTMTQTPTMTTSTTSMSRTGTTSRTTTRTCTRTTGDNVVVNGDFSRSDASWTLIRDVGTGYFFGGPAPSGQSAIYCVSDKSPGGTFVLKQLLSLCPGKGYNLTFAVGLSAKPNNVQNASLTGSLDSTTIVPAMVPCGNGTSACNIVPSSLFKYRYYQTIFVASGWSQNLTFSLKMGPPYISWVILDAISAVQLPACGRYVTTSLTTTDFQGRLSGTSYSGSTTKGVLFTTGPSTPPCNKIDSMQIGFALAAGSYPSGRINFTIDLRGYTFDSFFGSLVPSSTLYASDAISISVPTTVSSATKFTLNLTSTEMPNIAAYSLPARTNMSLIAYKATTDGLNMLGTKRQGVASSVATGSNGYSNVVFFASGTVWDPTTNSLSWSFGRSF